MIQFKCKSWKKAKVEEHFKETEEEREREGEIKEREGAREREKWQMFAKEIVQFLPQLEEFAWNRSNGCDKRKTNGINAFASIKKGKKKKLATKQSNQT